jgi:2-polyprenyl-3-methyl-5-hydroxy-6-metoxy-1,4-benzoquinol methylase
MPALWRSLIGALGWRRKTAEVVAGTKPVDILRLISPLRYDVVVRREFFELLAGEEKLAREDFDRFVALAGAGPYREWFERVYCVRFHPELNQKKAERDQAFRERVRRSVELYRSFRATGFQTDHPITLKSGRTILPSDSGKRVEADIFVGDGCHRLALLLMSGVTRLEPGQYRVKIKPRYAPLDNTILLLPALDLAEKRYAAFVSHAFDEIAHDSLAELEKAVAKRAPHRIEALRAILSRDARYLHGRENRLPGTRRDQMNATASKGEVEAFLKDTRFSGYQSVPLPHGLRVPGKDKGRSVDFYLAGRVGGKSLLDVGTYYGLYPAEAMRMGATHAAGVELDPERFAIARRIAELHGSTYRVLCSRIEEFDAADRYDVVLFLNVLHHVLNPIEAVEQVARLCRETLIVEFCLPWDDAYLKFLKEPGGRPAGKLRAKWRSRLLRLAGKGLPLMAVGDREYHRTFYFSPEAFRNLFVIHHKLFESIEFHPSPENADRRVAVCRMRSAGQWRPGETT